MRSGAPGIIYDLILYSGSSGKGEKYTGKYSVLKLIETLPRHENIRLFFDNWFCSLPLCLHLKEICFIVTATIRADRVKKCPLPLKKDLRKEERGSYGYSTDLNSGVSITKWFDNKSIQICATHCNFEAVENLRRWNRKSKKFIDIPCPTAIKDYNKSMGGVDLSAMLTVLYGAHFKTKRWYLKELFHCIDISKINAWLLHRRHCAQLEIPKKHQMSLLKFTSHIASVLVKKEKSAKVVRPSK